MQGRVWLAMIGIAGLAGCTEPVAMTPTNAQAQAVGSPRLDYFRGLPGGPMRVLMPSGENLPGKFQVSETGPVPPTPGMEAMDPGGGGNFYAAANGPTTRLVCRANLVAGHGPGVCRGQDGATYQLQF